MSLFYNNEELKAYLYYRIMLFGDWKFSFESSLTGNNQMEMKLSNNGVQKRFAPTTPQTLPLLYQKLKPPILKKG